MILALTIRPLQFSSALLRWLLFNRIGRIALLTAILAALAWANRETLAETYTLGRDRLLEQAGIAWGAVALWMVAALAALRLRPRLLVRDWHRWLGALALSAPLAVVLAQFSADLGSQGMTNLGGDLGLRLAGSTLWSAAPVVLVGTVVGIWLMAPRRSTRAARGGLSLSGRGLWSSGRGMVRLYRRARPERWLAWGLIALAAAIILLMRKIVRLVARPQRVRPTSEAAQESRISAGTSRRRVVRLDDAQPQARARQVEVTPTVTEDQDDEEAEAEERAREVAARTLAELERTSLPATRRAAAAIADGWDLPSLGLLQETPETEVDEQANQEQARLIEQTLGEYGIEVQVRQVWPGPTVTMFGLAPGWVRRQRNTRQRDDDGRPLLQSTEQKTRVKVDSILAREKDLALVLAAPSIRFEAPVPGESVVGIEVPNRTPSLVTLRSVMDSATFEKEASRSPLAIALGTGAGGQPVAVDLARMPHLLIAGSTGSGKSVCLNSVISCMLLRASPMQLRMLLVDPKRVELTPFNGIPHLLVPVVVEPDRVVSYLRGVLREMDRRYRAMESAGVRNIEGYNASVSPNEQMPYLLVGIDELADLMLTAAYDVEHTICRLAQLGRATGIHLVVATQRPSVDVVTGLIKANFPSRISFNVTSQVDSRTILDGAGAEKLLGRGDMLFLPPDAPKPRRVQGTFISDNEIADIVQFWSTQHGPPLPEIVLEEPQTEDGEMGGDHLDEMFQRAVQMATTHRHLSTSLLQRRLRIGYPRAARLREQLEAEGVIAPSGEVLISD